MKSARGERTFASSKAHRADGLHRRRPRGGTPGGPILGGDSQPCRWTSRAGASQRTSIHRAAATPIYERTKDQEVGNLFVSADGWLEISGRVWKAFRQREREPFAGSTDDEREGSHG